jgi:hypothetical protein
VIAVGNLDLRCYKSCPLIVDDNCAVWAAGLLVGDPECSGREHRTWLLRDTKGTVLASKAG